jgi:hypothetical protein
MNTHKNIVTVTHTHTVTVTLAWARAPGVTVPAQPGAEAPRVSALAVIPRPRAPRGQANSFVIMMMMIGTAVINNKHTVGACQ